MKRVFLYLSFLLHLSGSFSLGSSIAPPYPYKVVTNNGRYVFYMLPRRYRPSPRYKDLRLPARSGLYQATPQGLSRGEPLWQVRWYSYKVYPPEDGRLLARLGGPIKKTNQMAISFYQEGQLIKEYPLSQLVPSKAPPIRSRSHILWLRKSRFLPNKNQLIIYTVWSDRYIFSLPSGEIITKDRLSPKEDIETRDQPPQKSDGSATSVAPTGSSGRDNHLSPPPSKEKSSGEPQEIPSSSSSNKTFPLLLFLIALFLGGGFWYYKKKK